MKKNKFTELFYHAKVIVLRGSGALNKFPIFLIVYITISLLKYLLKEIPCKYYFKREIMAKTVWTFLKWARENSIFKVNFLKTVNFVILVHFLEMSA